MKKKTVIIISIVAASIAVMIGLVLLSTMAVNYARDFFEDSMDFIFSDGENIEKIISELAEKHDAKYWSDALESTYTFQMEDALADINNKNIIFMGDIIDITKEGSDYFVFFDDDDLYSSAQSIIYKLKATKEQVKALIQDEESYSEGRYYYSFIVAASVNETIIKLREESDFDYGSNIVIKGVFLEATIEESAWYWD